MPAVKGNTNASRRGQSTMSDVRNVFMSTPQENRRYRALARRERVSFSELVRRALEAYEGSAASNGQKRP